MKQKYIKRTARALMALLVVAIAICFVPQMSMKALAAETSYQIWVGNTQVTDENKDDILGDGTASFDPGSNTLTLDGTTIKEPYSDGPDSLSACIYTKMDKIVIQGSATMENNSEPAKHALGINASGCDLELNGTFNIKSGDCGIIAKDITFSGGKTTVESGAGFMGGIDGRNIEVKGGIVISTSEMCGMAASESITIGADMAIAEPFDGKVFKDSDHSYAIITDAKGNAASTVLIAPKSEVAEVTFDDGQGTTLKVENVLKGTAATAPEEPTREGYLFVGWDKDFSNVTENMTVSAKWGDPYPVWVGKTQVSSVNKDDILGDGTASFDPDSNTLTLNGATIKEPYSAGPNSWSACIHTKLEKLIIKGSATMENNSEPSRDALGIYAANSALELDGTFNIKCGYYSISAKDITFSGGEITAKSDSGIQGTNIEVKGGILTSTGNAYGMYATNLLTIDSGQMIVEPAGGKVVKDSKQSQMTIKDAKGNDSKTVVIAPKSEVVQVKFVDGQGKTLKTQNVLKGKAATAPKAPTRSGYTFNGWDKTFSKVAANMTVTAKWKQKPVSIANAKVVLSAASFAYNGKVRKPSIKTINGKALKSGTDYTVKWSNTSSKNVGSYTVTITGKGKYTGVTKATYKINPKGTSLKKPKKAKKAITVKWKKQSKKMSKSRITGYQIQLATDKQFTKNKKTVTVKGYKKVSKKVKKLKAKKKYYIRIRTYKTVSGQKYYSGWSKVKAIKTK